MTGREGGIGIGVYETWAEKYFAAVATCDSMVYLRRLWARVDGLTGYVDGLVGQPPYQESGSGHSRASCTIVDSVYCTY